MNILFCSEGFIVDGVASYNLHMAAALREAGHRVAVLGRWLGWRGYQERHRATGVEVLQYISPNVVCGRALGMAAKFRPDVIITDGRRAFPLALAIRKKLGTPIVTNFMDRPKSKNKRGRTIEEMIGASVAWTSPEIRWIEAAQEIDPGIPVRHMRRAVVESILPAAPLLKRDPFKLLSLGRLSSYKFAGPLAVARNATRLRTEIPSLEITFVGGGWRRTIFMREALGANASARRRFVRTVGYQLDPAPWLRDATAVVGGSTCGLESILANRPIIAVSAHWFGHIVPENLEYAVSCYYGERDGLFPILNDPDIVVDAIIDLYHGWEQEKMEARTKALRDAMLPRFSPELAAREWEALFEEVL